MRNLSLRLFLVFGILGAASCLASEPVGDAESGVSSQRGDQRADQRADQPGDQRADLIECRDDSACPRGSYCEAGQNACFTSSRCYVDGRPSDAYCERLYGDGFICHEYAPGSHHCMPTE